MRKGTSFWDRTAILYDCFMSKDRLAYEKMYELIRPVVRHKTVLELATGTGLIAKHIADEADRIEATDASYQMIEQARKGNTPIQLHFSVQDMFDLPYEDQSFDVVILSNALHIIPHPERALQEVRRVLRDDGVLVAPNFTHGDNRLSTKAKAFFMKLAGFPLHSQWTKEGYLSFLEQEGWLVRKSVELEASFPLAYAECTK